MSNHYLSNGESLPDSFERQQAANPTYQLNELPADEVLRYSLAGVTRVERARLRILLEESQQSKTPHLRPSAGMSLTAFTVIGIVIAVIVWVL